MALAVAEREALHLEALLTFIVAGFVVLWLVLGAYFTMSNWMTAFQPFARSGRRPELKNAVFSREVYAQLNVNPNLFAVLWNFFGVFALPPVMSCRAARFFSADSNVSKFSGRACWMTQAVISRS